MIVERLNMIDSISPASVNRNYAPIFKGEMPVQQTKDQEQKSNKSWMLWTGLAALAAGGIYLATRGKAGEKNITGAVDRAAENVKSPANSEKLADDMKFYAEKIGKMNRKVEVVSPKLQSEELYNKILAFEEPFAKETRTIENFEKGKLLEDPVHRTRKYVVGDKTVAIIRYDDAGQIDLYAFYDNGKLIETASQYGEMMTTEIKGNKLIKRYYTDDELRKIATETTGKNGGKSVLTCEVGPDGTVTSGQWKTYFPNGVLKKQADFRYYRGEKGENELQSIRITKLKPVNETAARCTEISEAVFNRAGVIHAERQKWAPDGKELASEIWKKS